MDTEEQLKELNAAFLVYARSEQNPHGGYAAYEVGEPLPWLVVFMAGSAKRFATAEEAKDAVEEHVSYATDAYLAEMSYLSESE